jgi:hypothetical protein
VAVMAYGADYDKYILPAYTEIGGYVDGIMKN